MNGRNKVLTVLPVLGHPRDSKRVAMLKQEGFDVEVAAFERRYHQGRLPDAKVTILGQIGNRQYFRRAIKILRAIPKLRALIRNVDVVYTSGPDLGYMALLAGIFLNKPVVIEVGDIREVQTATGILGALARYVDRKFTQAAALIVVTAEGFARDYYRKWLNVRTPILVVENKLEPGLPRAISAVPADDGIRIGYFGMLRCQRSWATLERIALERPDIELVVGGIVFDPPDLLERLERLPNARWLGEYKSPKDLPAIYGQIDVTWASPFPAETEHNWRWARSNRFYESCHFAKPLIAYRDSGDGQAVRQLAIGLEVGQGSIDDDVALVLETLGSDLDLWRRNIASLPASVYTYGDEAERLAATISDVLKDRASRPA